MYEVKNKYVPVVQIPYQVHILVHVLQYWVLVRTSFPTIEK